MSYTTIYLVPDSGGIMEAGEFNNSHGSASFIWCRVASIFFGHDKEYSWLSDDQLRKDVWATAKDPAIPGFVRISMCATFDRVMVRRENLHRVSAAFRMFVAAYPPRGRVCSLLEQAELMDKLAKDSECCAVCWNQTSVGDAWPSIREDGEFREYDITRDEGHWFLFDELKIEEG